MSVDSEAKTRQMEETVKAEGLVLKSQLSS